MSTLIMSACWELQNMTPAQKAVLVSLADQANDSGVCWPGIKTIERRTCLSERAVQEALRWLQATGAVYREFKENTSTVYTVTPQNFNPERAPAKRDRRGADGAPPADGAPGADGAPPPAGGAPLPRTRRTTPPQEAHQGVANGAPKSKENRNRNRKGTTNEPFPPAAQPGGAGDGGADKQAKEEAFKAVCRETWTAYELAYGLRYKTPPVRNAKVNMAVTQLVKRLGIEAPEVARFFVEMVNEAFVSKRCHAIGDLLAQCEAYRTQWVAGIAMTSTAARQADKTAANHSVVPGAADKARQMIAQRRGTQGGAHAG